VVASPAVSADGQVVAFVSDAPDLVPGDTNGVADVFVHDYATGRTERVSLMGDGAEKLHPTTTFALSPDGRRVAFEAMLGELLPGIGPPPALYEWVGVHDRVAGTTDVAVSPVPQFVVAVTGPQFLDDGFLSTSQTLFVDVTVRISPFGGCPGSPLLSGDGHWCAQLAGAPTPGLLVSPTPTTPRTSSAASSTPRPEPVSAPFCGRELSVETSFRVHRTEGLPGLAEWVMLLTGSCHSGGDGNVCS
jgi:hypothetical protein